MARRTTPGADEIYSVLNRFVEVCLRTDGSLFTPGISVWTKDAFEDLYQGFVDHPDYTPGMTFIQKLDKQLATCKETGSRLMAELLYIHFLITVKVSGKKKLEIIEHVFRKADRNRRIPDDLIHALDFGLLNPGTHFNTGRDAHIAFLIEFGRSWKSAPITLVHELLDDPWKFKSFVEKLESHSGISQRLALLHLVHPNTFEAITSQENKKSIAQGFVSYVKNDSDDVDRQILQIREGLAPRYGAELDFYGKELKPKWHEQSNGWTVFVRFAKLFQQEAGFDERERNYKLRVMEEFGRARSAVLAGAENPHATLKAAIQYKENNLTRQRAESFPRR